MGAAQLERLQEHLQRLRLFKVRERDSIRLVPSGEFAFPPRYGWKVDKKMSAKPAVANGSQPKLMVLKKRPVIVMLVPYTASPSASSMFVPPNCLDHRCAPVALS